MLADDRHLEIAGVVSAVLLWERVTQPAGGVRAAPHLRQELLPFASRNAAIVEIGARVLTPVIEEPDVVAGLFQRDDLALDELVERIECRLDLGRYCEVHHLPLGLL